MASGSKRKRGDDEYVFIDGHAMRADEVVRIELADSDATLAPGQKEAAAGAGGAAVGAGGLPGVKGRRRREASGGGARSRGLAGLRDDDAFALTDEAAAGEIPFATSSALMQEERHVMRMKYLAWGVALAVVVVVSLCMSSTVTTTMHTPLQVIKSVGAWFQLTYTQIFHYSAYTNLHRDIVAAMPYYADCTLQIWMVFKYVACGALLAVAGMLYQNTFRNPIAAPSMLGVSNGISFALFILVVQFGYAATQHLGLYYLYSFIGGLAVLLLVMLGGKFISGPGRFNVVNMILMGTVISQLLGVVLTYAQAYIMDDAAWDAYYLLQNATGIHNGITYGVLIIGSAVSLIPIILFRFRLNLVSFSDQESKLLGVNPNKLRLLTLGCGSLMVLVAQLIAGQVSMASLIIPFIVRAVFGSEMRKQLAGNLLVGALLLLVCGDFGTLIKFDGVSVGLSMVVSVVAIPLFIWMQAIRQRGWE